MKPRGDFCADRGEAPSAKCDKLLFRVVRPHDSVSFRATGVRISRLKGTVERTHEQGRKKPGRRPENGEKSGRVYCANCINYRAIYRIFCGFFGLRIEKRLTKILRAPTMKSAVSKVRKRMRCSLQADFPPIRFPEGGGRKQEGEKA